MIFEILVTMALMSVFFYFCFPKEMFLRMMDDIARSKDKIAEQTAEMRNARRQLDSRKAIADYQPGLTQAELNAVDWGKPWPSVTLIEQEQARMARYLLPIFEEAGFPTRKTRAIRNEVERNWLELQGKLHQKVFGALELPPFFDLLRDPRGLIMFEMTRHDTDHYGNEEWIGVKSRWIYGRNPPQLSDPLSEVAT